MGFVRKLQRIHVDRDLLLYKWQFALFSSLARPDFPHFRFMGTKWKGVAVQERPITPSELALQRAVDAGHVRRSPRDSEHDSRHRENNPSLPSHLKPLATKPALTITPPEINYDDGCVVPPCLHNLICKHDEGVKS